MTSLSTEYRPYKSTRWRTTFQWYDPATSNESIVDPSSSTQVLWKHDKDVKLEDFELKATHLGLYYRQDGLQEVKIFDLAGDSLPDKLVGGKVVEFDEKAYSI